MNHRSQPLDLLRTLAIFLVFTNHFNQFGNRMWFGKLGDFGWAGVDLFFVLSGYLISSQLFKELKRTGKLSFKNFYLRRGFRIWPNYLVILAIYAVFPAFAERGVLGPLWKYLTFTLNFGLDLSVMSAFSHAWSLSVEEQFYTLLPPLLLLLVPRFSFRKAIALASFIFIFGVCIRDFAWHRWTFEFAFGMKGYYRHFYETIYYPTYCRLDSLTLGVCIAALQNFRVTAWEKVRTHGNATFIAGVSVLTLSFVVTEEEYSLTSTRFGYTLNAFAFGLLLISALSTTGFFSKFKGAWATYVANLAFAFYLVHKAIIHHTHLFLTECGLDPGSILYPILTLFACWLATLPLYYGIERTFMRLRDRLISNSNH